MHVSTLFFMLLITVAYQYVSAFSQFSCSQNKLGLPNRNTSLNAKEICVLGGGFGGLNAALTLSSLNWGDEKPTITLVDKKERFVFLPLLYELCVGDAELNEVAPTYADLLKGTDVQFKQATIQGIDVDNDTVYVENEVNSSGSTSKIHYDSLIVATGADVNLESIPGAKSCALPFYTIEDCLELRKRLTLLDSIGDDLDSEINVVVVGGGYSGVELALNMNERLKRVGRGARVTLVHRGSQVLEYATNYNRKTGIDRLKKAGIEIVTGTSVTEVVEDPKNTSSSAGMSNLKSRCIVSVESVSENDTLKETDRLNADILLWTAGAMSTNTQRGILNSKLPRDSSGRIVTDQYLEVTKNVFSLGDCSRVKKIPYGATAAVAMQQAPFAAWNAYVALSSEQNNHQPKEKPLPFSYLNLGEMLTLGGEDASISSMGIVEVSGSAASVLRRLIYAIRMPTSQQALNAAISSTNKRLETLLLPKGKESPKK